MVCIWLVDILGTFNIQVTIDTKEDVKMDMEHGGEYSWVIAREGLVVVIHT